MLIDKSYFIGELNIPGTERLEISERLDLFIQKYEEQLLRDLLGYDLYKQFMAGLEETVIENKWNSLLLGAEYSWNGKLKKWDGLIHTMGAASVEVIKTEPFDIVVGRGGTYDPLPNGDTVVIPPAFAPFRFTIWQRAYGKLRSDEYEIQVDDEGVKTLKLLKWKFEADDTYTYMANNSLAVSSAELLYESLIANYVYWHWLKDQFTVNAGIGVVISKGENATVITPTERMVAAWNGMSRMISSLVEFLSVNETDYPDWVSDRKSDVERSYRRTNVFGI